MNWMIFIEKKQMDCRQSWLLFVCKDIPRRLSFAALNETFKSTIVTVMFFYALAIIDMFKGHSVASARIESFIRS